jgi:hypothetical protein
MAFPMDSLYMDLRSHSDTPPTYSPPDSTEVTEQTDLGAKALSTELNGVRTGFLLLYILITIMGLRI